MFLPLCHCSRLQSPGLLPSACSGSFRSLRALPAALLIHTAASRLPLLTAAVAWDSRAGLRARRSEEEERGGARRSEEERGGTTLALCPLAARGETSHFKQRAAGFISRYLRPPPPPPPSSSVLGGGLFRWRCRCRSPPRSTARCSVTTTTYTHLPVYTQWSVLVLNVLSSLA